MDNEILIYCPKCTRQIVTEKSRLGTNMLCPHCGHTFAVKSPKRYSENKAQLIKILGIIGFVIACGVGKWAGPKLYKMISPKAQEKESFQRSMELIEEYSRHFRQYGQVLKSSGILDIYMSKNGQELYGEVTPKKYRQGIESCLKEAKTLNSWCKDKKETFDLSEFKGRSINAGKMIRDAYDAYFELTTLGTNLFARTLECHRICCGSRDGASKSDVKVYQSFYDLTKDRDVYGRKTAACYANYALALKVKCDIVYKMAKEYADLETRKIATMRSYVTNLEQQKK